MLLDGPKSVLADSAVEPKQQFLPLHRCGTGTHPVSGSGFGSGSKWNTEFKKLQMT
jgi:hypothetical protein